jgi:acyl-CoA thioesterase-1
MGDSLSAGYGLAPNTGWVTLLTKRIEQEGYGFRVVNASVSGETSAGGLARLPRALQLHAPKVVVLELGANDGLRALPIAITRANVVTMIKLSKQAGSKVLLLGIRLPPNYGVRYTVEFERMMAELGKEHSVAVVPWFMRQVAENPAMMQGDGLHPNLSGQPLLLENVWPALKPLLGTTAKK